MLELISAIQAAGQVFFRRRRDAAIEILALRQQLAVQKEASATEVEPRRPVVLDHSAPHLVRVGRGPHHC